MSKLEELLKEYCPNGVEYKALSEIATIIRGDRITKKEIVETGLFPVVSGGQQPMGRYDRYNREANTITISSYGAAGYVDFQTETFWANDVCLSVFPGNEVENKYLYYYLKNQQFYLYSRTTKAIPDHLPTEVLKELQVPLPALPVQREIVRVLDSFTLYCADLTADLTAELTARRKQYEYYRDKLLTFDTSKISVKKYALSEIAEISTGTMNTEDAEDEGAYPFFVRSQEPLKSNRYQFNEEAIITAGDGVGVGKVFHYIDGKYALHQRAYRIHPNQSILKGKFLFHYFTARFPNYICKKMFEGSVPSIRRPMLNEFSVTIPSIEVQERIVKVLDNFDAICSDLGIGLPAEIEKRQKQYEYYRDKLLTF